MGCGRARTPWFITFFAAAGREKGYRNFYYNVLNSLI
jgi:hypothetical protein